MNDIKKTNDYEIFKFFSQNREINRTHVRNLAKEIAKNNMLHLYPMLVDLDLYVYDGQHRLEAAKILGLEVYYHIHETIKLNDLVSINKLTRQWNLIDYVNFFSKSGNEEYIKLSNFLNKSNMAVTQFCSFFHSSTPGGSFTKTIRSGKFKFPDVIEIERFNEILMKTNHALSVLNKHVIEEVECTNSIRMKNALMHFIGRQDVDYDELVKKLRLRADAIKKCVSAEAYLSVIKKIYNWNNRNPVD